jgi:hypothetical protein
MFIYTANLVEADVFTTISHSIGTCILPCPLLSARLLSVKFPFWFSGKTLSIMTEVFLCFCGNSHILRPLLITSKLHFVDLYVTCPHCAQINKRI